jgi:hypothetical protein
LETRAGISSQLRAHARAGEIADAGSRQWRSHFRDPPPLSGFGLARLPQPSDGDIFLDFEGDPFVDEGGLEFLFGYAFRDAAGAETYKADWALTRARLARVVSWPEEPRGLAAITMNANAASRFFRRSPPDYEEVEAALARIALEEPLPGSLLGGAHPLMTAFVFSVDSDH